MRALIVVAALTLTACSAGDMVSPVSRQTVDSATVDTAKTPVPVVTTDTASKPDTVTVPVVLPDSTGKVCKTASDTLIHVGPVYKVPEIGAGGPKPKTCLVGPRTGLDSIPRNP